MLDDPQKELLEKYRDAQGEMEDITRYDTFAYALRSGILLMVEAFVGRAEMTWEDRRYA